MSVYVAYNNDLKHLIQVCSLFIFSCLWQHGQQATVTFVSP